MGNGGDYTTSMGSTMDDSIGDDREIRLENGGFRSHLHD